MSLRITSGSLLLGLGLMFGLGGCSGVEHGPSDASSDSGTKWPADGGRLDGGGPDVEHPDGGSPDGGVPGACTGKPGAQRGKNQVSVNVGGKTRTFIYYTPANLPPNQPVPLIISPHGFAMTAEDMYTLTGFKELADREGVVAVFPDGNDGSPWNVGSGVSGWGAVVANPSSDDQGFIDAILAYVEDDQCIDTAHIFVSGFSMGGYFSNEVGCLRSDIASVGPHSGGSHNLSKCPGTIKPVIVFHGTADLLITYKENGVLARNRWVERNGCAAEVDSRPVDGGTCDYNRGCPDHGQVALCHFEGMAHAWAGGQGSSNADPNRENAAELAWKFWKEFAW